MHLLDTWAIGNGNAGSWVQAAGQRGHEVAAYATVADALASGTAPDLVLLVADEADHAAGEIAALRATAAAREAVILLVVPADATAVAEAGLGAGADDVALDTDPGAHHLRLRVLENRIRARYVWRDAEDALRAAEERYELAVRGANDGVWDWDLKRNSVYYSERWAEMLGFEPARIGDSPDEWLHRIHPADKARFQQELQRHLRGRSTHFEFEHRILTREGTYRWVLARGAAVRDAEGLPLRIAGSITDISERGVFDPLTGLANRILFHDRLQRAIDRLARRPDRRFAVLYVDLDRFKQINDSMGHAAGDTLLVAIARRMEGHLRSDDTIARIGGDEFAVLLEDIHSTADAEHVVDLLREELAAPFEVQGRRLSTSVSIGIALAGPELRTPKDFMRAADTAMYRAKHLGRARSATYTDGMQDEVERVARLEGDLRQAVDRREFAVYLQPIVDLEHGRLVGFEALLRWLHPEAHALFSQGKRIRRPETFLAVAEETGLIVPIGWWVLEAAASAMQELRSQFPIPPETFVSVNLAASQLRGRTPQRRIEDILTRTQLPPENLKLEVTESMLMTDIESASEILQQIARTGTTIAIDDFGTGYSSLQYLTRLPVQTLKIDRSFVAHMLLDDQNRHVVTAVLQLAGSLEVDVVAEGVEHANQVAALVDMGCPYGQGYHLAPPLSPLEVRKFAASRPRWDRLGVLRTK